MVIKSALEAYKYAYDHGTKFPNDWYVVENFKWNEVFKNEGADDGYPIYEVYQNATNIAKTLQVIRDHYKVPIIVHCWVRQIPHNKRAGSTAKLSAHINGLAVDFHVQGISEDAVRSYLVASQYPVRIEKNTKGWVHIDKSSYVTPFRKGLF